MARPKQKKVKLTRGQAKIFDKKHFGDEPVWPHFYAVPNLELIKIFNYYNYMCLRSDATEFLMEYLESIKYPKIKKLKTINEQYIPTSICWTARLIMRGIPLTDEVKEKIVILCDQTIDKYYIPSEKKDNVIVLEKKVDDRLNDIIGDLDELLDKGTLSCYQYLTDNAIPRSYIGSIISYYTRILDHLNSVATDKELQEGYKHLTKKEFRDLVSVYETIINDCNTFIDNKKQVRKPRAKKKVSVEKKVAAVKLCERFDELKLVSRPAEMVLGAKELWVFDTRYKTVTHFVSSSGFDIKGTTVLNVDASRRWITGRKSEQFILKLNDSKKNIESFLKTQKQPLTGVPTRLNQNMLILSAK